MVARAVDDDEVAAEEMEEEPDDEVDEVDEVVDEVEGEDVATESTTSSCFCFDADAAGLFLAMLTISTSFFTTGSPESFTGARACAEFVVAGVSSMIFLGVGCSSTFSSFLSAIEADASAVAGLLLAESDEDRSVFDMGCVTGEEGDVDVTVDGSGTDGEELPIEEDDDKDDEDDEDDADSDDEEVETEEAEEEEREEEAAVGN